MQKKVHISVQFNEFCQLYTLCSQHPKQELEYVHLLRKLFFASFQSIPCPFLRSSHFLTFVTKDQFCQFFCFIGMESYSVLFCFSPQVIGFFHSRWMFLWFIHVVLHTSNSLFYCWVVFHCEYTIICSFFWWWVIGIFQFCVIMNKAAMNILIQVLSWPYVFISFG